MKYFSLEGKKPQHRINRIDRIGAHMLPKFFETEEIKKILPVNNFFVNSV